MNTFKKMLQFYKTGFRQDHEATCGPTSMILATLGFGFEKKQASEWINPRFSSWMPVEQFLERGMALHELQFISECIYENMINVIAKRAYPENFSLFWQDITDAFQTQKYGGDCKL